MRVRAQWTLSLGLLSHRGQGLGPSHLSTPEVRVVGRYDGQPHSTTGVSPREDMCSSQDKVRREIGKTYPPLS